MSRERCSKGQREREGEEMRWKGWGGKGDEGVWKREEVEEEAFEEMGRGRPKSWGLTADGDNRGG